MRRDEEKHLRWLLILHTHSHTHTHLHTLTHTWSIIHDIALLYIQSEIGIALDEYISVFSFSSSHVAQFFLVLSSHFFLSLFLFLLSFLLWKKCWFIVSMPWFDKFDLIWLERVDQFESDFTTPSSHLGFSIWIRCDDETEWTECFWINYVWCDAIWLLYRLICFIDSPLPFSPSLQSFGNMKMERFHWIIGIKSVLKFDEIGEMIVVR